jgi:predicted glycosyltransferase
MNQEASLLGIPVISCFPGDHLITDQYLAKEQLLYRIINPEEAAVKALEILQNRKQYQSEHHERAEKLMQQMENPAEIIFSQILAYSKEKLEKK